MINTFTERIKMDHTDCEKLLTIFKRGNCFIDKFSLPYTPIYKRLKHIDTEQALVIANTAGVILFSEFYQDELPNTFYIRQKPGGAFGYSFH